MTGLECDHCGDVAIERDDGLYNEDMHGDCATCGYPGHVSFDEDEDGAYVEWRISYDTDAVCKIDGCHECTEVRTKP